MYDKIEETEKLLTDAKAKKKTIEEDKLIGEIHIHEEPQENGQWLKSIKFRLPVIGEDVFDCLDIQNGIECVAQFTRDSAE